MSDGANTMIEHDGTLESQLGTMVINTEEEEEEGTMKSKNSFYHHSFHTQAPQEMQRIYEHMIKKYYAKRFSAGGRKLRRKVRFGINVLLYVSSRCIIKGE